MLSQWWLSQWQILVQSIFNIKFFDIESEGCDFFLELKKKINIQIYIFFLIKKDSLRELVLSRYLLHHLVYIHRFYTYDFVYVQLTNIFVNVELSVI